jgi:hypothetical protein
MNKRIKSKHQHHEEVIRQQIEEEIFQDKNVFFEKKLQEATEKYLKRIDYLVGANNELMRELILCEQELTHAALKYESFRAITVQKDCVSIPNNVADCIVLEENF